MIQVDRVFGIASREEFDSVALELFRFQARACRPYGEYLSLTGVDPAGIRRTEDIPCLPIELFKSHDVYCGASAPQKIFTSSNTGGTVPSRHMMADLSLYERSFTAAFEYFYGPCDGWSIYGLLPNYLQRGGSSLVYMVAKLLERCGGGGFYLDDCEALLRDMAADPRRKILLGVSYALWDLAERFSPQLRDTVVMETGGMKGQREELPREEFHALLQSAFGVERIESEYGMAELTSQAYSRGGGVFRCPPWMRVEVRDLNDPRDVSAAGRGGLNIIDLANVWSCAFIETQDVGSVSADGSFTIAGRADRSEIRGCNLLVQ